MTNLESAQPMSSEADWSTIAELLPKEKADQRNRRQWRDGYARKLFAVDTPIVVAAVAISYWLRFRVLPVTGYTDVDYPVVSTLFVIGWMSGLAACRTRSPRVIGDGVEEYRRVVGATMSVFGAIAIVSMLFKLEIARGYLAIALPLGLVGLLVGRVLARRAVARARRVHGAYITPVVAVGDVRAVTSMTKSMASADLSGYVVVGACITGGYGRDVLDVPDVGEIPVFGDESAVLSAVDHTQAETVALTATEHLGPSGIRDLSWELEKLDVDLIVSPGMADVAGPRLIMRPVAGLPLIHVEKPQYSGTQRFEKRAFDVLFSGLVLIMTLPLTMLIGLAIKLTSRGPMFYLSDRIGLDGEPFRMIKFRTMIVDADKQVEGLLSLNDSVGGVLFKMRDDPRVTPLGKILRRYSLDELPQFINVLLRDMSVVGPRPPLPCEVLSYDYQAKRRLLVRPGITGLWQVSGRSDLSWEESVRLDLFYVENWSMMADLLIVIKTVRAMLGHSGAY